MNDFLSNLDKLQTTDLGQVRVRHNLELDVPDVVAWCRETTKQADMITRKGKNWYVYHAGIVITINAHSFTIITAHKANTKVRVMKETDYDCLNEFLYQALFIPEGAQLPPRSVVSEPEIFVYIKDFGTQAGDLGVVAEQNGQIVGAAWTRIVQAYGHINKDTPELAISILPGFRGYGIGTKLMKKLFEVLRENGYVQTSLSVQKNNPAVRFYQRLGYTMAVERLDHAEHEDYLMIKKLHNVKEQEMSAEDAANIIKLLDENGIEVYVVGGWGVDALLGEQTRKHGDLDIALPHRFVPKLRELLEDRGYRDVPRDDTCDYNFVLGDDHGHLVDVHSYSFDVNGKNIYGIAFEPHHLTGTGTINGYPVNGTPPDVAVEYHTGYDVGDDDYRDVKALCERFHLPLPKDYEEQISREN